MTASPACTRCGVPATRVLERDGSPWCEAHVGERSGLTAALTNADRALWSYGLEVCVEAPSVVVARLIAPGGETLKGFHFSAGIAFLPGSQVAIYGGVAPGRRYVDEGGGVVSHEDTDLPFFTRQRARELLCVRFLERVFSRSAADAVCAAIDESGRLDCVPRQELRELRAELADLDVRADSDVAFWKQRLFDLTEDESDVEACYDFDAENADLLCAIHRRFRLLWAARPSGVAHAG